MSTYDLPNSILELYDNKWKVTMKDKIIDVLKIQIQSTLFLG